MYESARLLVEAGQWEAALDRLEQIRAVDPSFPDSAGLTAQASEQLAAQKLGARLDCAYDDSRAAIEAGQWREATELLEAIEAEAPEFRDVAAMRA